jgi:hypothetical protein
MVLASDSRVMDNTDRYVLSDTAEKSFEIAPETFSDGPGRV